MRILHLFDHSLPLQSGYTFRSRNILKHQRKLGWNTVHLTSPKHIGLDSDHGTAPDFEDIDGLRFHRTERISGLLDRLPLIGEVALIRRTKNRLLELAMQSQPDVILAHSPVLNALAALPVGRELGIPVVYEIRAFWEDAAAANGTTRPGSLRFRLTRALENYAMRHADAVTTICRGLKDDMIGRGVPEDKITLIPNAVNMDDFDGESGRDSALATELGIAGRTVLGFIGSFYPYEGIDLAIDALPKLLEKGQNIALLLLGGGPEEENLKAQARAKGLQDRVIFTGRVPHQEVPKYAALIDLFVFPRKSMRLTELVTPLKPLEAMAQRKLVAASDVGGHQELIRDGETGTLFPPDDVDALADCVDSLLRDRVNWQQRLDNAQRFIKQERTWQESVENYVPVFESLTHG